MINNKKENNLNEINSSKQKMSLFKTVEAEKAYLYSYNEALKLWPVQYETHNIQTRYGNTHVIVSGPENADSIVLVHGFMFSSTMWFSNIAELSANYRVFAVDIIADFNKSIPINPPINRQDYKDWLIDVFNELKIEKANIIGHSFGGFLSASFAILAPERVKKIILLAPAATIVPLKKQLVLRAISAMVLPGQRIKENFLKWFFAKGFLINKRFHEQFVCGLKYCNFLSRVFPSVLTDEELKQILVPTLFMVGDKEVVMTSNADAIIRAKKLISNIETEIVPNAGHLISMEQPSFINISILKFLSK